MTGKDWSEIFCAPSCAQKIEILSQELNSTMGTYFPRKSVKKRIFKYKPWITSNIKLLISKRQSAFIRHGKESLVYKFWRSKVQRDIKLAKSLYYNGKINYLAQATLKNGGNKSSR